MRWVVSLIDEVVHKVWVQSLGHVHSERTKPVYIVHNVFVYQLCIPKVCQPFSIHFVTQLLNHFAVDLHAYIKSKTCVSTHTLPLLQLRSSDIQGAIYFLLELLLTLLTKILIRKSFKMTRPNITNLPDELLLDIMSHFRVHIPRNYLTACTQERGRSRIALEHNAEDLRHLSLTCKKLRLVAQKELFHTIVLAKTTMQEYCGGNPIQLLERTLFASSDYKDFIEELCIDLPNWSRPICTERIKKQPIVPCYFKSLRRLRHLSTSMAILYGTKVDWLGDTAGLYKVGETLAQILPASLETLGVGQLQPYDVERLAGVLEDKSKHLPLLKKIEVETIGCWYTYWEEQLEQFREKAKAVGVRVRASGRFRNGFAKEKDTEEEDDDSDSD